jgi:hypothetical protein
MVTMSVRSLAFGALSGGVQPVRVKKARQFENPAPRFDSIEREKALDCTWIAEIERASMPERGYFAREGNNWCREAD